MPAPAASTMKELARQKFMSFKIVVPTGWKEPQGEAAQQYAMAFQDHEKVTEPGSPPLFVPASLNKLHTDAQKMMIATYGGFIDGICTAICAAWSQWQAAAKLVGVIINGPTASGGNIVGPPLTPLILASAPKNPFSHAVAQTLGPAWLAFTASVKVPALKWYPAFAACPTPVAPPTPNIPMPFAALTQSPAPLMAAVTKGQMVAHLANPNAPHHQPLFESIAYAFEQSYNQWKTATMVTNVLGTGPAPSTGGPVAGGVGTMSAGGFA